MPLERLQVRQIVGASRSDTGRSLPHLEGQPRQSHQFSSIYRHSTVTEDDGLSRPALGGTAWNDRRARLDGIVGSNFLNSLGSAVPPLWYGQMRTSLRLPRSPVLSSSCLIVDFARWEPTCTFCKIGCWISPGSQPVVPWDRTARNRGAVCIAKGIPYTCWLLLFARAFLRLCS